MIQKRVAREIILAGVLFIILSLTYLALSKIEKNTYNNLEAIKKTQYELETTFENIEPYQRLWFELKEKNRFNGTYNDFLKEYGTFQKSEVLFNLAKNNDLYDKPLDDFQVDYYKQESALQYLYNMESFQTLEYEVFLDSIMLNETFTKNSYEMFIFDGYNKSLTDFKELMRGKRTYDESITYTSLKDYQTQIELNKAEQDKIKTSIFYSISDRLLKYLVWLLCIIYGLRIIYFLFKWSLRKINN